MIILKQQLDHCDTKNSQFREGKCPYCMITAMSHLAMQLLYCSNKLRNPISLWQWSPLSCVCITPDVNHLCINIMLTILFLFPGLLFHCVCYKLLFQPKIDSLNPMSKVKHKYMVTILSACSPLSHWCLPVYNSCGDQSIYWWVHPYHQQFCKYVNKWPKKLTAINKGN